ncbi:disease resistance protein Roq1-like [Rhodamnia argentea]|uniref:Disease resistance protein Roq1-like n=1 Tax=Rhodamnia argentea TaxID=178133 RepID=A0ABM3H4K2_9MYRT|nr:disease resistance protein Roq1-like [Rhodamnia argentea]
MVSDVASGKSLIPLRPRNKRVFVILDDVDDEKQLHALAGKAKWFGSGSRILVTTRDSHFPTPRLGWDHVSVYEVKVLDDGEARELLGKHAFPTYQKLESRTDLVRGFLNHAKGLPLALEVLGSLLRGTTEDVWESILKRLSTTPNQKINNVLKVSYDGLEKNEREIFLHVACFFKGRARDYTESVLDSCDLQTTAGFDTLIKRSLIRIEHGNLQMHDLIQSMGMHMCMRRSRLWLYEDVLEVLSRDMGDCAVKAIVLELPKPMEICIGPVAFTKMRNLRLLILCNVSFQGPIRLPNQLRWLGWAECSPWIPEFSSGPNKLVVLDIRGGRMEGEPKLFEMPGEPRQFEDFQNLKHISFCLCNSLVCTPDLLGIPNLEELEFQLCSNLVEAHKSIAYHDKLRVLKIHKCFKLSVFPMLKSKSLQVLSLADCKKFERFPDIPHKLEGLKELNLDGTAIKELPPSIEHLVSLQRMSICRCMNLKSLPSSIYKLQNLEELKIRYCPRLVRFPKYEDLADPHIKTGLSHLRSLDFRQGRLSEVEFLENLSCCPLLRELDLYENEITSLPTSLHKRDHLSVLRVSCCRRLREIPELPSSLNCFQAMDCDLEKSGHLTSFDNFVRRGLILPAISSLGQESPYYNILIPGVEMPEWVLPFEGDSISFMASEDLYRKFLGLVLCFVFCGYSYDGGDTILEIEPYVNGKSLGTLQKRFVYMDSVNIYLEYTVPFNLFGEVDFGQIEGSYVQFSLRVKIDDIVTKGLQIICKPLQDDLKIEIRDNHLMDLALLMEVDLESTYSKVETSESIDLEAESLLVHKDYSSEAGPPEDLQDCQMRSEEHSQIVVKSGAYSHLRDANEDRVDF